MEPLHLPFFLMEEGTNRYALFLPGFRAEDVESIQYEFDAEDEILRVFCRYAGEGRPKTEVYPVAITDLNRDEFESMQKLVIFSPEEYEPEQLTSDPERQEQIRDFFEQLDELAGKERLGEDENG